MINPNFIMKEIDNEYVLVPIGQEAINIHGLLKTNEIGKMIFDLLSKGLTDSEIVTKISEEYDAPIEVIKKDYDNFVNQLKKFGVIL